VKVQEISYLNCTGMEGRLRRGKINRKKREEVFYFWLVSKNIGAS